LFWLGELVEFGETVEIFKRPRIKRTEEISAFCQATGAFERLLMAKVAISIHPLR
jgi:hypothetical protein